MEVAGWSQAEVARQMELTPGAISQICNGKTTPSPLTLNLLKLTLASRPETLRLIRLAASPVLSAREQRLIASLRKQPRARQQRLYTAFEAILAATGNGRA